MMILTTPSAFRLPTALLRQGIALRAEADGDRPFLMALFATTRAEEMGLLDWNPAQKQLFLAHQFNAQRQHYRHAMENCEFYVIERRSNAIGRLYLQEQAGSIRIVDILLSPLETGKGIGTAMLRAIFAAALRRGRSVVLQVEKTNAALRLYRRLGFVQTADFGIRIEMERSTGIS